MFWLNTQKRLVAPVYTALLISSVLSLWVRMLCVLSLCVWVLCLGLHMEIFTQMSWHCCGKSVCRSETTKSVLSRPLYLTGTPTYSKENRRGRGRALWRPSLQEEPGQRVGEQLKPLSIPPSGPGKALNTHWLEQNNPAVICLSLLLSPFPSHWFRRSLHATGDQTRVRIGSKRWKTRWPPDHIYPHPSADYKPLCGRGMPSTLLMAAKMWLPQGPE